MTHLIGRVLSVVSSEPCSTMFISVLRHSGCSDTIPIKVSNDLLIPGYDYKNKFVFVKGCFISDNIENHLALYVKAHSIVTCEAYYYNGTSFDGYVCKQPIYRLTPKGREISDVIVAVNNNDKASYIPCVCWESNSHIAANLHVGDKVHLVGRIQSRIYNKNGTERTAYEFSVDHIQPIEKESC